MVRKRLTGKNFIALGAALLFVGFGASASAQDLYPRDNGIFSYHESPRYRASEEHPLRLAAYLLHPVGWLVREGITRPWSSFAAGSRFNRSFFGFREPFDYRETICFDANGAIPDCKAVAPLNAINGFAGPLVDGDSQVSERQVYIPDIAFDFNRSTLNALGKGRVRQVAQLLSSVPDLDIVVEGHADVRGSDKYNQNLGLKRAKRVMKELAELGVDPARLAPKTYGESRPVFAEGEEWAYAVNRRVQFTVGGAGDEMMDDEMMDKAKLP